MRNRMPPGDSDDNEDDLIERILRSRDDCTDPSHREAIDKNVARYWLRRLVWMASAAIQAASEESRKLARQVTLRKCAVAMCMRCSRGEEPIAHDVVRWAHRALSEEYEPCPAAGLYDLAVGGVVSSALGVEALGAPPRESLDQVGIQCGSWQSAAENWIDGRLQYPSGEEPQNRSEADRLEESICVVLARALREAHRQRQCRCAGCEVKRLELWIEAATEATKEPRRLAGPRDDFLSRLHRAAAGFYDLGTTQAIYEAIGAFGRCTEEGDAAGLAILRELLRDRTRERDRTPDRPDCGKKPRF